MARGKARHVIPAKYGWSNTQNPDGKYAPVITLRDGQKVTINNIKKKTICKTCGKSAWWAVANVSKKFILVDKDKSGYFISHFTVCGR